MQYRRVEDYRHGVGGKKKFEQEIMSSFKASALECYGWKSVKQFGKHTICMLASLICKQQGKIVSYLYMTNLQVKEKQPDK